MLPNSTLLKVWTPLSARLNAPAAAAGRVSLKPNWPGNPSGLVCLRMMTVPQLVMLTLTGAMKSLSAELNVDDDRLLSIALPNDSQTLGLKIAWRSIEASPKVRALSPPSPSASAAAIAVLLRVPTAAPLVLRSVAGPQTAPCQRRNVTVARAPPWSMLYSISRSPTERFLLMPLAQVTPDLLNSKSISVVPLGSCTRAQKMWRKPGSPAPAPASV